MDCRQAGIRHLKIEAGADNDIEHNVCDRNDDQESGNCLPFHKPRKIGNITETTTEDICGKRHKQTADAQCLFRIILRKNGKVAKIDKKILFHIKSI